MGGCCNEMGCRRRKPMMLMRSDLTGAWYVVTAYTEQGDGLFRASAKHRLPDNSQDQLEDMRDGHALLAWIERGEPSVVDGIAEAMAGWPMDTAAAEDAEAWRANARAALEWIAGKTDPEAVSP